VTVLHLFFGDAFNTTLKTPHYVSLLLQQQWLANWHLFTIFWWLTCTPILAVFIARLSRGYSWRATIIATLALPIIIALALLWQPFFHVLNAMDNMPSWLAVLISVAGLLIFIVFIARKQMFSSVMHTYLPRVDTIKYRNPDRFINHVLQFTTIMLCIYLATGILLLNVLFVVFLLIFSLVLIFLPLALLLTFTRAVKNISSNI
jgi:choline-glycine betaine transporter